MKTSIFVCAHNPREDFLLRVLASCINQKGLTDSDEILLVDSGSNPPLAVPARFSAQIKVVREEKPGLGLARARGILETTGDILVFVDDDTVLEELYVANALDIFRRYPFLGAIGGQLIPEYEGVLLLPERYYRQRLALREFQGDHWSNRWDDFPTSPIGGGMVVRRAPANVWAEKFAATPWRNQLGRRGNSMSGAEDADLNHTLCALGYGKGIFEALKLTHIVPKERLEPEFLVRITEGNTRSWAYLRGMLNPQLPVPPRRTRHRVRVAVEAMYRRGLDQQLFLAEHRGTSQGWELVIAERKRESAI
jgi:hypothetical protein